MYYLLQQMQEYINRQMPGPTQHKKCQQSAVLSNVIESQCKYAQFYVSTYSGFYRSTDFGDTWTQVTTGIYVPADTGANGIRIAVSPADSNRVYLAMVAKKGTVFQSTDGGSTFAAMKDSHNPNLTAYSNDTTTDGGQGDYNFMLAADPVNADILYLGAHMFWKSTNGGSTHRSQLTNWWAELHTDMHWVRVNPYNASEVWTANDGGVWLSTNGGVNWTPKSDERIANLSWCLQSYPQGYDKYWYAG